MQMKVKAGLLAILMAFYCISMCSCQNSGSIEDNLENNLNALDEMDEEEAEEKIEEALGDKDNGEDSKSAETEEIDPFENLTVTFSGTAPKSEISVSGGNSLCSYTPDITEGMKNGDIITITAELKSQNDEVVLSETQKQYTADELASYAMKLEDIPEEALEKLNSQAEDMITSSVSRTISDNFPGSLESMENIGYWLITGKEGFETSPYCRFYTVYKVKASVTAWEYDESLEGDYRGDENQITDYDEFYSFCRLDDIVILADGTCSFSLEDMKLTKNGAKVSDKFANSYGYKLGNFWSWAGYRDLDSMFKACITDYIDKYDYESTVQE